MNKLTTTATTTINNQSIKQGDRLMKKLITAIAIAIMGISSSFAGILNYNSTAGYFTFNTTTEVSLIEVFTGFSGSILEVGWYNYNDPTTLNSSLDATTLGFFNSDDVISIWVKCLDHESNTLILTTTPTLIPDTIHAGSFLMGNLFYIGGIDINGGEFYSYTITAKEWYPKGEPLPGVISALVIGGAAFFGRKFRNKIRK